MKSRNKSENINYIRFEKHIVRVEMHDERDEREIYRNEKNSRLLTINLVPVLVLNYEIVLFRESRCFSFNSRLILVLQGGRRCTEKTGKCKRIFLTMKN